LWHITEKKPLTINTYLDTYRLSAGLPETIKDILPFMGWIVKLELNVINWRVVVGGRIDTGCFFANYCRPKWHQGF
jgi:hypothetical protein